jgi:hypothetical protein
MVLATYPPPAVPVSPIRGLIDLHVHSAPDVFGRCLSDNQVAQLYRERGLEAFALKGHTTSTAARAWLVRSCVPGIAAFGGIVLNRAVGGINPDAVTWMVRMQGGLGRLVWFPTFDSSHHVHHFQGEVGGIEVVDNRGEVLPAVRQVLDICAREQLAVCTGHLSPQETLALVAAAREAGCERISVTHAALEVPGLTLAQMQQAARMGAKIELAAVGLFMGATAHLGWMRSWRQVTAAEYAAQLRAVGAEQCHLSTDLGQAGNPTPADGYELLVESLMAEGITSAEITLMGREVAGSLLQG